MQNESPHAMQAAMSVRFSRRISWYPLKPTSFGVMRAVAAADAMSVIVTKKVFMIVIRVRSYCSDIWLDGRFMVEG